MSQFNVWFFHGLNIIVISDRNFKTQNDQVIEGSIVTI